jgi:hypothetical protein
VRISLYFYDFLDFEISVRWQRLALSSVCGLCVSNKTWTLNKEMFSKDLLGVKQCAKNLLTNEEFERSPCQGFRTHKFAWLAVPRVGNLIKMGRRQAAVDPNWRKMYPDMKGWEKWRWAVRWPVNRHVLLNYAFTAAWNEEGNKVNWNLHEIGRECFCGHAIWAEAANFWRELRTIFSFYLQWPLSSCIPNWLFHKKFIKIFSHPISQYYI